MSINKLQVLIEFKSNLINFIDELIEQFPEEGDFVVLRIFLNDQVPIADVMSIVIQRILPHKEMVRKRDDNFFMNHNGLFEKLEKEKVNHFKLLWRSGRLDADDRSAIWRWYDLFISLAEKYQKAN
jgi:hypothetical protein